MTADVAHQNAVAAWGLAHKHSAAQNRRVKFDYKMQLGFAEDLIWIILTVMFATLGKDFCLVMIIEFGYPRWTKVGEPLSEEKASWLCALLGINGEKLSELVDNFLGRDGNEKFSGPAQTRRDLSHSSFKRALEAIGDDLVAFMPAANAVSRSTAPTTSFASIQERLRPQPACLTSRLVPSLPKTQPRPSPSSTLSMPAEIALSETLARSPPSQLASKEAGLFKCPVPAFLPRSRSPLSARVI